MFKSRFLPEPELRNIPGFEDYMVTQDGRVYSKPRKDIRGHKMKGKWLKPQLGTGGYLAVNLYKDGKLCRKDIHRLVLETFVGSCPPGKECRHLNSNPTDNRLENLRWDTKINNEHDKLANGTLPKGENHGQAKLTKGEVELIRELFISDPYKRKLINQGDIAEMFDISEPTISRIKHSQRWT